MRNRLKAISALALVVSSTAIVWPPGIAGAAPPTPADAVSRADAALAAHRSDARASNDDTFTSWQALTDEDGSADVRYSRTYRGVPVRGGDIIVHLGPDGRYAGMTVASDQQIALDPQPVVPPDAAAATARGRFTGTVRTAHPPVLAIDASAGAPRLVWETVLAGTAADGQTPSRLHVFTDAVTGTVRATTDEIETSSATAVTANSGTVTIEVTPLPGSGAELKDGLRGNSYACDLNQHWDDDPDATCDHFYKFDNGAWGNGTNTDRRTAGTDAQYDGAVVFDYYKTVLGRNGVLNTGAGVPSRMHYGTNFTNAFWSTACQCMTYGDRKITTNDDAPYISLDIAGHEMTHGVTEHSVPGGLTYSGESGGLNEATSDILGEMVEFYANNSADPGDYLHAEKTHPAGQPGRYMFNPTLDGKSDGCWTSAVSNHDVHYSSGIANHAFFMLAESSGNTIYGNSPTCGGAAAVPGIGRDAAAKIWYRALTHHFTSTTRYVNNSNPDNTARAATLRAARDLYGLCGKQYQSVQAAWTAVGVTGTDQGCFGLPFHGYVLANQPSATAPYQPPADLQANTSGGPNTVTRTAKGRYTVTMPALGYATGGMVHATAYGDLPRTCDVQDWYAASPDAVVLVHCFDDAGADADAMFTASFAWGFTNEILGYAWIPHSAAIGTFPANPLWSYNSRGGAITVQHLNTGNYRVHYADLAVPGGMAMVTAQGGGTDTCMVTDWMPNGTAEDVLVSCHDHTGAMTDSAFDLTFTNQPLSVVGPVASGGKSGYLWAGQPTTPLYQASATWSYTSSSSAITIQRMSAGFYVVSLPGLGSAVDEHAQVTAVGGTGHCRVTFLSAWGTTENVNVKCYTPAGAPVDSEFNLMFLG